MGERPCPGRAPLFWKDVGSLPNFYIHTHIYTYTRTFSFGREATFISDRKFGRMRDKNKQENFAIEKLELIKTHDKTLIFRMECERHRTELKSSETDPNPL